MDNVQSTENTKPILYLDGEPLREDFRTSDIPPLHYTYSFVPAEVHSFTTKKVFEDWLSSSRYANGVRKQREEITHARALIDQIGSNKAELILSELTDLVDHFGQRLQVFVNKNLLHLTELKDIDEVIKNYKVFLPGNFGTAKFYKHKNYKNKFMCFHGLHHWSCYWVGESRNDKLSSLEFNSEGLSGYHTLTIYEHKGWKGRELSFTVQGEPYDPLGPPSSRKVSNLSGYPYYFNDKMSSFKFTEW